MKGGILVTLNANSDIDAYIALKFINDILKFFQDEKVYTKYQLCDIKPGSLSAWISAPSESIKHITNLIEKLLFYIPEWKNKSAIAEKTQAEANILNEKAKLEKAKAEALKLIIKNSKELGTFKITFPNQLIIERVDQKTVQVDKIESKR